MIAIGKIGIWFAHNAISIAESVAFAQKVEACGYGALWVPEAIGREPFVHLAYLASKTSTLVLAWRQRRRRWWRYRGIAFCWGSA